MEETLLGRTFTGPELAKEAGLTYRRVDYYTRCGVLEPVVRGAGGHGSRRTFSERDLARAKLVGALLDLGAELAVVARALRALAPDPADWPEFFFVARDGTLRIGLPLPAACWWISKRELLQERDALEPAA